MTTHDLDMAQELCDQVNIIHKGRLITDLPMEDLLALYRQENYEIRVRGHLHEPYPSWTNGLVVTAENGHTMLSGGINSQSMLHRVLDQIRETDLPLAGVQNIEPNLEDIFVQLITEEGEDGS